MQICFCDWLMTLKSTYKCTFFLLHVHMKLKLPNVAQQHFQWSKRTTQIFEHILSSSQANNQNANSPQVRKTLSPVQQGRLSASMLRFHAQVGEPCLWQWTVLPRLRYFLTLTLFTGLLFTGLPGSIPKITSVSYAILLFLAEVTYVNVALLKLSSDNFST